MNRQLLAQLMQQPNVTSGAASPTRAAPTGQSVDRNRMLMEILSQPVETPRTQPGQIAPVDASMVAALANIGGSMWGAHSAKRADEESRELLARELAMMQGGDPLADPVQPIESPVLSGRVGIRQGPGAEEAMQATEAGILPFVEATEATRRAEQPARQEHDLAALLDPRASQLAAQRIAPPPGDPFTLGAGQARYDSKGNVIAESPHAPGTGTEAKPPASIAEYNLAKDQGYGGTFEQWQNERARGQVVEFEGAKYILNPVTKEYTPISTAAGEISASADKIAAETAAREGGVTLTPGQKAVDTKFADDYVQWQAVGGFADVQKNLSQLQEVQRRLESGKEQLSGTMVGNTPRAVLAATNPGALDALEQVEEVIQRNLRLILGAQFTEREGERLISRGYNPRLSEAENAKRIGRLSKQLEDAAKAKDSAAQYFAEHGTLSGWGGRLFTLSDFESALKEPPEQASTGEPASQGGLPEGITEADIEYTMQQHGLTRQQVLERINAT